MLKITMDVFNDKQKQKQAVALYDKITDITMGSQTGLFKTNFVAYLMYKASLYTNPASVDFNTLISEKINISDDVIVYLKRYLNEKMWDFLLPMVTSTTSEILALTVLYNAEENLGVRCKVTPLSLIELSRRILDIKDSESVADIGCGVGNFIIRAGLIDKNATYDGYEIEFENYLMSQIRTELVGLDASIKLGDVFYQHQKNPSVKYDKIFGNYPFGVRIRDLIAGKEYMNTFLEKFSGISASCSSDWVFNALICDMLKSSGKAIGIITAGSGWNTIDIPIRKYFIENGLIESIIALPEKIFGYTAVFTNLVVLSKNNSKSIRMVDAKSLCVKGRRVNYFSENNITSILELLDKDSENSQVITIEELRKNNYTLSLERYKKVPITSSNFSSDTNIVRFESIVKKFKRGAPLRAAELDEMVDDNVTNMQYLMLANIKNGIIDSNLPYLSKIDSKYEKYCLNDNDLILSKNGYPYKVAIVSVKEGHKILANGNMYAFEIDTEKANPYYIKALFESEIGIALLKSITVGATIPNLGLDSLKKLEIPLPSLLEQDKIAASYLATLDEISVLKMRLDRAYNKLQHILDKE